VKGGGDQAKRQKLCSVAAGSCLPTSGDDMVMLRQGAASTVTHQAPYFWTSGFRIEVACTVDIYARFFSSTFWYIVLKFAGAFGFYRQRTAS
jgi:hypothetical protein